MPALPALIALSLAGLFLTACNEEPRERAEATQAAPERPNEPKDDGKVDPAAPRMIDPIKPGGSGSPKQ
jgi:hypothetical protein